MIDYETLYRNAVEELVQLHLFVGSVYEEGIERGVRLFRDSRESGICFSALVFERVCFAACDRIAEREDSMRKAVQ